jgi:hypothetical protein
MDRNAEAIELVGKQIIDNMGNLLNDGPEQAT